MSVMKCLIVLYIYILCRGMTIEDVLKENSLEVTDEHLSKLKYDPTSVWRYVEV